MKPEDREALLTIARRFLPLFTIILASVLLGLWVAGQIFPATLGQLYESSPIYVVTGSVMIAATFGGLYSAVSVLKSGRI